MNVYGKLSFFLDGREPYFTLKMPAKRIKKVEAYMGRGCPVLWITPDKKLAESIRKVRYFSNFTHVKNMNIQLYPVKFSESQYPDVLP